MLFSAPSQERQFCFLNLVVLRFVSAGFSCLLRWETLPPLTWGTAVCRPLQESEDVRSYVSDGFFLEAFICQRGRAFAPAPPCKKGQWVINESGIGLAHFK